MSKCLWSVSPFVLVTFGWPVFRDSRIGIAVTAEGHRPVAQFLDLSDRCDFVDVDPVAGQMSEVSAARAVEMLDTRAYRTWIYFAVDNRNTSPVETFEM